MSTHHDVVCTFCGCLCDDLEVEVRDNQITGVKKACSIGKNKIMHALSDAPVPSINGPYVATSVHGRLSDELLVSKSFAEKSQR